MGGRFCCIRSCRNGSHDHRGRKLPNQLTFHCFPAWRMNEGAEVSELTRRRRAAWVAAVRHSNISFDHIPSSMRVCSRHFLSGKPAYEMLESDPDWAPSLHLGHGDRRSSAAEVKGFPPSPVATDQKQRWPTDARPSHEPSHKEADAVKGAGHQAGPVLRPWREARALLSALQRKPTNGDQDRRPTETRTRIDFMDFFRDALEASLEASSRSTAPSQRRTQRRTCDCPSSSSPLCVNCVKMRKRIEELEEQLLYLTGREQDALTSPVPNMAAAEEEEGTEWMKPLSPTQDNLHDNDEDAEMAKDVSSSPLPQFHALLSEPKRPHLRYVKSWLATFPFLRYSPTRDVMWCHACRLYADKQFHKLGLIRGSRVFKTDSLKKHSESKYHNDSVQIYNMLHK